MKEVPKRAPKARGKAPVKRARRAGAAGPGEAEGGSPLDEAGWKALHEEAYRLWVRNQSASDAELDTPELVEVERRFNELCGRYRSSLPAVPIARCPYSGEVITHSLDQFGLDGLWWRCEYPVRPRESGLGKHFLVLTGAAIVPARVPYTPHLVRPGPEVPFVIDRLFQLGDVTAVIKGLRVGGEKAWAISYYAKRPSARWGLANSWGTDLSPRSIGPVGFEEPADRNETEYEYELGPSLDAGRLLWIAEDDEALTLRRGRVGCPYLDLPGLRELVRMEEGERWSISYPPK